MQYVQVIPFENSTEKKWLMKKYKKCINATVEAFEDYIMIEIIVGGNKNAKKKVRKQRRSS